MSVNEDKNESNSQEDHEDNSDEENSSDENSSRPRLMDQDRREYNLSKLFNEEQSDRYDKYKVSSIEHDKKNRSLQKLECPRIKKICQNLLGDGIQIGNLVQIIINGVTKIYAGELVEEAKKIMVEETEAKINRDDNKSVTVLNGICTAHFYNSTSYKRQEYGLNDYDFIIVFSGRLTKEKGILQLIQAIKKIQMIPNIKLMIVGASAYGKDKHPTPFINLLEEESEQIKDKVIFTGFVNYDQVPSYLKMADIAIVPSMWEEPFGLTVVEAMASGLPLITTRSGGIPEICEGVATIVNRDHIVDNLATAILDLYQHPEKREQMSKASLERSRLFDKETYAKNFFSALEIIKHQ